MSVASFLACDTIGIELMEKEDELWGAASKSFPFLTWKLDVWVQVHSDVVEKKRCGLWVSLTKRLWLYLNVGTKDAYILVFDAQEVGIVFDKVEAFGGGTIRDTIIQIRKAVKAVFKYAANDEKWKEVNATDLDKQPSE